ELTARHHRQPGSGQETAALQLAQLDGVVVGDALDDQLFTCTHLAERPVAYRPHFAAQRRDGVAVRVELRTAEELEDALLHPLRDHVLETLRLLMDLVERVAQHPDQEHLEQAVMPDQLEGHLPSFTGELLAAVAVVLDQSLGGEPDDHLTYARRRDAQ